MKKLAYASAVALLLASGAAMAAQSDQSDTSQNSNMSNMSQESTSGAESSVRMTPSTVRLIQEKLSKEGYDTGGVDGKWGQNTSKALMNFQRAEGLQPTGKPNRSTLQALNVPIGENANSIGNESNSTSGSDTGSDTGASSGTSGANDTNSSTNQ